MSHTCMYVKNVRFIPKIVFWVGPELYVDIKGDLNDCDGF